MNKPISNLHLQKILYYLQVHFAKQRIQLYVEEIYAWQYGPVVPEIYYLFAGYGASKIANKYDTAIDEVIEMKIKGIVSKLMNISPWKLVEMTHTKGNPWDVTYQNGKGLNQVIDFSLLVTDSTGE